MKGLLQSIGIWLRYNPVFYKLIRAEYIRFARSNEYLISLYRLRFAHPGKFEFQTRVQRCIGCSPYGRRFSTRIANLKNQGVEIISHPEMSLEEFTAFSKDHPILYKDSWVRMRLTYINQLPHYPEPGTS